MQPSATLSILVIAQKDSKALALAQVQVYGPKDLVGVTARTGVVVFLDLPLGFGPSDDETTSLLSTELTESFLA